MRAIPKRMLPNTVSYKKYIPDEGEGATYLAMVYLTNVKVEEKKTFHKTKDGNEIIGNAILFYDYVNSNGLTSYPTNESVIIFNDRTYHIVDTETLRGNSNTPHHYEIILR